MEKKAHHIVECLMAAIVLLLTGAATFGVPAVHTASVSLASRIIPVRQTDLEFDAWRGHSRAPDAAASSEATSTVEYGAHRADVAMAKSVAAAVFAPQRRRISEEILYAEAATRAIFPSGGRPKPIGGIPVLYPELVPICACESSFHGAWWDMPRHFENGRVLMNYSGNDDIGMCQINISVYGETARRLGYDLETVEGNINFSNWLFEREGSAPWYHSESCWRAAFAGRM